MDLQRASNEASSPEDKRSKLILNANWNYSIESPQAVSWVSGIL
jgi:hypothetical protein